MLSVRAYMGLRESRERIVKAIMERVSPARERSWVRITESVSWE